jgi:dihydroorotase-like cyclic amidohydrolase
MKKIGPYAKVDPPIRGLEDQKALWRAVNEGIIEVIASDHAPYPKSEKNKGWNNIFDAPSGSVGVETSMPLMLDCVNRDLLRLERLVEVFSTNPAKILRIYPKKGALIPGADADLVVVDMKGDFTIEGARLHSKEKITAFEGYQGRGLPLMTVVRGEIVMDEGVILGRPGYGKFLSPVSHTL